ncbi:MAG: hypothetical protein JO363_08435 [Solirubrobacterales bacterium]|nr:hypothetical protein [Solirubrobacterales bacterium]
MRTRNRARQRDAIGREAPMVISPRRVIQLARQIAGTVRELFTKARRS